MNNHQDEKQAEETNNSNDVSSSLNVSSCIYKRLENNYTENKEQQTKSFTTNILLVVESQPDGKKVVVPESRFFFSDKSAMEFIDKENSICGENKFTFIEIPLGAKV